MMVLAEARAAVADTQALGHSSSLGRVGPVHAAWPADGLGVDTTQCKVNCSKVSESNNSDVRGFI